MMRQNEPGAADIAAMDEAERAEWFYDNREQVAEESTPAVLDRVVSVRVSPGDLGMLSEAASAAGMKLSAWLRKVGLEAAATAPSAAPAAILSGDDTQQLQDSVRHIVALLQRSGIGLDPQRRQHDQPLILKRASKRRIKVDE
ncbi:hypothetical protein F5972_04085 [Microbispora cellulosiformans]|uniref:Uncharacterized protein n=1 Tax=Microbispora cellulosiformans TaxID=2614688 RepID=A0A5J5KAI3_9ACTN|nr:hypothetical protein [Microbispora cellulosiformans]KAA9381990.1 hypothetical protein F5972_04085 [Microbispora cellulosiformans]